LFLQKALWLAKVERPFGGPHLLVEKNFEYIDQGSGGVSAFLGTERIFYQGGEVYQLEYHGGVIKYRIAKHGVSTCDFKQSSCQTLIPKYKIQYLTHLTFS
jgi:hypothetical protein